MNFFNHLKSGLGNFVQTTHQNELIMYLSWKNFMKKSNNLEFKSLPPKNQKPQHFYHWQFLSPLCGFSHREKEKRWGERNWFCQPLKYKWGYRLKGLLGVSMISHFLSTEADTNRFKILVDREVHSILALLNELNKMLLYFYSSLFIYFLSLYQLSRNWVTLNCKFTSTAKLSLVLQKPVKAGTLMNFFLCYLRPRQGSFTTCLRKLSEAISFKVNSYLSALVFQKRCQIPPKNIFPFIFILFC